MRDRRQTEESSNAVRSIGLNVELPPRVYLADRSNGSQEERNDMRRADGVRALDASSSVGSLEANGVASDDCVVERKLAFRLARDLNTVCCDVIRAISGVAVHRGIKLPITRRR